MERNPTYRAGSHGKGRAEGASGEDGLNQVLNVRLTAAEKARLRQTAFQAGLSLSALARRRCLGRKLVIEPNLGAMEYVRRADREIRMLDLETDGQYRMRTEAALKWLRETMNLLGRD